jgi:UDP-3-O-[3-hydroxymyristoyl] N-acetylglucosamine deacetylase
LKTPVRLKGIGLHTGCIATLTINPALPNTGIVFRRTDRHATQNPNNAPIAACYSHVPNSRLCTKLRVCDGVEISTIEHLMAALAGCGIHNASIDLNGPEIPILDGSSAPFVRAFLGAGIEEQKTPVKAIEILKSVHVKDGDAMALLAPSAGFEMEFSIDFQDAAIGKQTRFADLANGHFVRALCDSRTFCRHADVEAMKTAGLALGGTYENAVVVDGDKILTPNGMRHKDEPVRHKMLDALGDLALAGAPILGRYTGIRSGHMMTNALLRTLFDTPGAYRIIDCTDDMAKRLPGVGVTRADLADVA